MLLSPFKSEASNETKGKISGKKTPDRIVIKITLREPEPEEGHYKKSKKSKK